MSRSRLGKQLIWIVAIAVVAAMTWTGRAGAREVRSSTRTSVNRNVNVDRNVHRDVNVNRHTDVHVRRDIDVDVDYHHHHHGGYRYPVATGIGVAAAATATALAIGTMVRALPPACSAVVVNGFTYQNCSGVWYQPQYAGTQVTYVVINEPR